MSWPLFKMISGATYSGVPQKVHVFFPNPIFLAKPKSTCWEKKRHYFLLSLTHLYIQTDELKQFNSWFTNLWHLNVICCYHSFTENMIQTGFFVGWWSLLLSYQFSIAPVVQYKVLWFEVSVNDSFGMQVGKGLHHTCCVKSGSWVLKWTPGNTGGQNSWSVICLVTNNCSGPAEPSILYPTKRFALGRIQI